MASFWLSPNDDNLGDDSSWFTDEPEGPTTATKQAGATKGPDSVKKAKVEDAAAAWKDWCRPVIAPGPSGKLTPSHQGFINQQAAIAMSQLKSGAERDEAEAMASPAAASLAMTKANNALKKAGVQLVPQKDASSMKTEGDSQILEQKKEEQESQDPMGKKAAVQKNEKIEKEDIPETQTKDDEKK